MRRLLLGVVFAGCVGGGVWAQVYADPNERLGNLPPCLVTSTTVAATSTGAIMAFVFTCQDGRVYVRREPTYRVPPEVNTASCPGLSPFPGGVCQDGGWLPVGHPARR